MLRVQGLAGINLYSRQTSHGMNRSTLMSQQKRFARRTVGKPHPRAALDPEGEPIINAGMFPRLFVS